MTFNITDKTARALQAINIRPSLVLEIEGVPTLFGSLRITRLIHIGDTGLEIGDDWVIGGGGEIEDQDDYLSIDTGSGNKITQQLQPDKGSVSSVSTVQLAIIDKNLAATRLISPGVVITDILGAKATLWIGFQGTNFKEDYIPVFSGIIDDCEAGAGLVTLNIAHPEQLKRQNIYTPVDVLINGTIDSVVTTIPLVDASGLSFPVNGPNGSHDSTIKYYIQVEDEIIRYGAISGNNLTGCARAALATTAATHTADDSGFVNAKSLISLEGTATDLAQKIMLSGVNGSYKTVQASRFNHPSLAETVANSIFFEGVDLNRDYGVTAGDYVTTAGATNGANNVSAKVINEIEVTADGSYIVIGGVSFVDELASPALVSFRSRYDSLGEGLGMTPDQVDVDEHTFWSNFLLANFQYRFVITDTINGKDFLDKEIYLPVGAYSLPRQGRASMGYHVASVVRGKLKVLNRFNVKDPDKIKMRRTINRNFYNTIVYKFDQSALTGKFASGSIIDSETSRNQIPVGTKTFIIESAGMRRDLDGSQIAEETAARYLDRYQLAAEFYEDIGVFFKDGYNLEPGDVVLLDPTGLKLPNLQDGTRTKLPKIFTIINKSLDLKTGDVRFSLVDANFDLAERYGSISPSSVIVSGTTTELLIQDSYGAIFPGRESKKWEDYLGLPIIVHSDDWSFEEEVTLLSIDPSNKYRLLLDPATPLSLPPSAGYIIDIADYPPASIPATPKGVFFASYDSTTDAEISNGSPTAVQHVNSPLTSVPITGNKLDLTLIDYSHGKYLSYPAPVGNFTQTGTIRLLWTPNYNVGDFDGLGDGMGPSIVWLVARSKSTNSVFNNHIGIYHAKFPTKLTVVIYDASGTPVATQDAAFSAVMGQTYEVEYNFDFTLGVQRMFIDGVLLFSGSDTATFDSNYDAFYVGGSGAFSGGTGYLNGKISELTIFDTVQHTANYAAPTVYNPGVVGGTVSTNALYKAVHAYLSDTVNVTSGTSGTVFDVDDVASFLVGSVCRVHTDDYSTDSGEVEILGVSGSTITTTALGFTPDSTMVCDTLPFPDGGRSYQIF